MTIPPPASPDDPTDTPARTPNADPSPDPEEWWRAAVIYQVYVRSFADSDGDGIGDLRGVLSRLDHLQALGVDAVWLTPFYPSPQADNGYDVAAYCDVDPRFGTLADVDELIAELHHRGMRLIIDVVFNHTSDAHPWFRASRSAPDDPHRGWYWWRPPRPGHVGGEPGAEPTNWGAVFSGSAWTYDAASGEYVLGVFSPHQPDLNWEEPAVRHALHDVLRFWLDRGVDGFRMDVINFISKDPALPDGPVHAPGSFGDGSASFIDGPQVHRYLVELRREVLGDRRDIVLIGEMPGTTLAAARRYTDPANGEVDMVVSFAHLDVDHGPGGKWDPQPLSVPALFSTLFAWQDGLADGGWGSLYLSNHDQPRHVSRFGAGEHDRDDAAKAIATVLHLQRGTPFVYQGEELGMVNAPLATPDELRDIESTNHLTAALAAGQDVEVALARMRPLARDNARTPLPWDDTPHAGFTTGTPWMPLSPDHPRIHAAAQWDDADSVLHHYRRLIALRHAEPIVVAGIQVSRCADHPQVVAYERRLAAAVVGGGPERWLVIANLSPRPAEVPLDDRDEWQDAEVVLATPDLAPTGHRCAALAPWEARVLRRSW